MAYAGWSKLGGQKKPQEKATWIIKYTGAIAMCSVGWFNNCSFMTNLPADSIASDTHSTLLSVLATDWNIFVYDMSRLSNWDKWRLFRENSGNHWQLVLSELMSFCNAYLLKKLFKFPETKCGDFFLPLLKDQGHREQRPLAKPNRSLMH